MIRSKTVDDLVIELLRRKNELTPEMINKMFRILDGAPWTREPQDPFMPRHINTAPFFMRNDNSFPE